MFSYCRDIRNSYEHLNDPILIDLAFLLLFNNGRANVSKIFMLFICVSISFSIFSHDAYFCTARRLSERNKNDSVALLLYNVVKHIYVLKN